MNIKEAMKCFLEQATTDYPIHVEFTNVADFRARGQEALQYMQKQRPCLWVLQPDETHVDVAALRWALPGGACPIVMTFDSSDAQGVTETATSLAIKLRTLVLLVSQEDVTKSDTEPFPLLQLETLPAPNDEQPSGEVVNIDSESLDLFRLDKHPADSGRAEWLVVSYGSAVRPATEAVSKARANGQRVDHLTLNVLYPVRDEVLLRATMGISHIVVAEPNNGQFFLDIKREVPAISVMHAGSNSGVTVEHVLNRLQKSPRCC